MSDYSVAVERLVPSLRRPCKPRCDVCEAESLLTLQSLYRRAANPAESFAVLLQAVDDVFAPLSADDSKRLALAFGINTPCRSKRAAVVAVRRRIEDRLESAQRCQF